MTEHAETGPAGTGMTILWSPAVHEAAVEAVEQWFDEYLNENVVVLGEFQARWLVGCILERISLQAAACRSGQAAA